ncbi:MAG: YhfC family glutamic-type intramembrane protease [Gemmatimonadales bacterium]
MTVTQGASPALVPFDPGAATGLAIAAAVCLIGPILVALWWHRRSGTPLAAFGAGALVFLVSQVMLRLPWQIPLGRSVQAHPEWLIPFLLFSSLTAGLFEETGRWAGYRYLLRKERSLRIGVMFGLGHGGLEAILLAGLPLAGLLVAWVMASRGLVPSGRALEVVRQQAAAVDGWRVLLAAVERASAIAAHVGLALIVLQMWMRGGRRWLVLAIALHFAVNATAAMLVIALHLGPLIGELVLVILAVGVLALGWRLARQAEDSVAAVW